MSAERRVCETCKKDVAVLRSGDLRQHKCEPPLELPPAKLPRALADLYALDAARPRSTQRAIGVSALGGCRRAAAETILGTPMTNDPDRLAATLGTAIHATLEEAARARNPFALVEHEVYLPEFDLLGHVDYADPVVEKVCEDWKTKHSLSPNHQPTRQQRWQVQVYAKALVDKGHDIRRVRLVFVPRDGSGRDAVVWEDDYREDVAIEALLWLDGVREQAANGMKPDPERVASSFCRDWCPFYDPQGIGSGCTGLADRPADVIVDDPEFVDAAVLYRTAADAAAAAADDQLAARAILEGRAGAAGQTGIVVSWSDPKPRLVLDEDAVREQYAAAGLTVPTKVEQAAPRISVKNTEATA
jgi:hypothetical protein